MNSLEVLPDYSQGDAMYVLDKDKPLPVIDLGQVVDYSEIELYESQVVWEHLQGVE